MSRKCAATTLGCLAPAADVHQVSAALLKVALEDRHNEVRAEAAKALRMFGSTAASPQILTALSRALDDKNYGVKRYAVELSGQLGSVITGFTVLMVLLQALESEDSWVRMSAAETLGQLGSIAATPEVISTLLKALREDNNEIRRNAAWVLGRLGPTATTLEVVTTLLSALQTEEDTEVNHFIITSLSQYNMSKHLHTLEPALFQPVILKKNFCERHYFSATPLGSFISTWYDTQHFDWLMLVIFLAFHRAIAITWQINTLCIQEEGTTTNITLPPERAAFLIDKMRATFAEAADIWGLPEHFYAALQVGKTVYSLNL